MATKLLSVVAEKAENSSCTNVSIIKTTFKSKYFRERLSTSMRLISFLTMGRMLALVDGGLKTTQFS